MPESAIDALVSPAWLGRAADAVGDAVKKVYSDRGDAGLRVKSILNGVWMGHPLHPALTDVPLGAWTAAVALDAAAAATGRADFEPGARAAIGVGLAGAVAAAVAGITDWSDTDGRSRRVGFVHGALNLTATTLFAASFARRRAGRDGRGRVCALLGYTIALGAAYLGGDLVYGRQIGVDHAAGQEIGDEFAPVLASAELGDGEMKKVMVGGTAVLLARNGGRLCAMADTCSHLGGPLSEGELKDGSVVCPWHGSRFALDDGRVLNGPATHAQPCFEARVTRGQIELRMPKGDAPVTEIDGVAHPGDARGELIMTPPVI